MTCCNVYQQLGIAAIVLAALCLFPQFLIKPLFKLGADSSFGRMRLDIVILFLVAAVICCGVALIKAQDDEGYQHPEQKRLKGSKKSKGSGKSLGKKLKENGFKAFLMNGCGFCTKFKKFCEDNPHLELDLIHEDDMDLAKDAGVNGFPTIAHVSGKGPRVEGYTEDISKLEELLE